MRQIGFRGKDISMDLSKGINHVIPMELYKYNEHLLCIKYLRIENLTSAYNHIRIISQEEKQTVFPPYEQKTNISPEDISSKVSFSDEIRKLNGDIYIPHIHTPAKHKEHTNERPYPHIEYIKNPKDIYRCIIKPYDYIELKNGDISMFETDSIIDVECSGESFVHIIPYWR